MSDNPNLLPHINRLPVELLQKIFRHTLSVDGCPDPKHSPMLLCQVCTAWRISAFGDPRLWNTLSLSFSTRLLLNNGIFIPALNNSISISRFWLKKTKGLPLTLSLSTYAIDGGEILVDNALIPYSSQIIKLNLIDITTTDLARFLELPNGHVDQLERLTFHLYGPPDDEKTMTVFKSAPRLRRVLITHLDDRWLDNDPIQLPIPWAQLTHLDIRVRIRHDTWRAILSRCTLLERCMFCVGFASMGDTIHSGTSITILPNLVDIGISHNIELFGIQDFGFPALAELEIQHARINANWVHASRYSLRFEYLRVLSLQRCSISGDDLLLLLNSTPSVTDPSIFNVSRVWHSYISKLFFDALTVMNTESPSSKLLVNLQVLNMCASLPSTFTPKTCADMIKSRWAAPAGSLQTGEFRSTTRGLRRVAFHLSNGHEKLIGKLWTCLEPYISEGLEVQIDTQRSPVKRYRTNVSGEIAG